jgi:hypothetical protein
MSEHFPIAVDRIISINFGITQRMQVTLTFAEREHERVLREVARLPGVCRSSPCAPPRSFFRRRTAQRLAARA